MKKLLSIFAIVICISCNKDENNTPAAPVMDTFDPTEMQVTLLKQGTLTGVGHTVYKFVLIWCQEFSVLFGKAELQ